MLPVGVRGTQRSAPPLCLAVGGLDAIDRAIDRSGATVLVSANPGCSMHLQEALLDRGVTVRHPVDVLAEALR